MKLIFIILVISLTSACSTRFIADFEADTNGALPDTYPAGSPDDQIHVLNFGSGNISISNSSPIDGAQSLKIAGPTSGDSSGTGNKVVFMYGESITSSDKRLYANWIGKSTSDTSTVVRFFSGHFATLIELKFDNGNIKVFGSTIGTYTPNQTHTVFMNVDPVSKSYYVSVAGAVSSGSNTSGTIPNTSDLPTGNIGLSFNLVSGSSSSHYTLDTVRMSERKPD